MWLLMDIVSAVFIFAIFYFHWAEPAPFAMVAPFAEQACDLAKHDGHCTLLSLCRQDWELLEARTELTVPTAAGGRQHWNKLQLLLQHPQQRRGLTTAPPPF